MKKIFKLLVSLLPTKVVGTVTANLTAPGTLSNQITTTKKYHIGSLKVIGPINKTDIQYICDMAGSGTNKKLKGNLSLLDLSEAVLDSPPANTLSSYLFSNCKKLNQIIIPQSTVNIEPNAFYGCTKLTSVIVPSANNHYADINGVLFNKDKNDLLFYPKGKVGKYIIPSNITLLHASIFQNCNQLTSIVIPESVKIILEKAFAECFHLKKIYCRSAQPPLCCNNSCFERVSKTSCTLYIPKGAYSNYWLTQTWGKFINIKEEKS